MPTAGFADPRGRAAQGVRLQALDRKPAGGTYARNLLFVVYSADSGICDELITLTEGSHRVWSGNL